MQVAFALRDASSICTTRCK